MAQGYKMPKNVEDAIAEVKRTRAEEKELGDDRVRAEKALEALKDLHGKSTTAREHAEKALQVKINEETQP